MDLHMIDPLAAAIILGGTLAATFLRCGWRDSAAAIGALAQLPRRRFAASRVRAELGLQIQEIDRDGLFAADAHQFGDGEFDAVADVMIQRRSVQALYDKHAQYRDKRLNQAERASAVFMQAAELAPVLGLAGTLIALAGLSAEVDHAVAIGTAVTTTLYGLVLANFIFAPLAAAIDRRSAAEESARKELLEWLAAAVRRSPHSAPDEPRERSADRPAERPVKRLRDRRQAA